jgi:hypothetical protein
MEEITQNIRLLNYWEHVKAEKELARSQGPESKKRIALNAAANEILNKIHELRTIERNL